MAGTRNGDFSYHHTQKGPWWLLMLAFSAASLTGSWFLRHQPAVAITIGLSGCFLFLMGMGFQHLTVSDEGRQLVVRFGPMPLLRRRIWYDDIVQVEKGRTTLLDGWGIHISLRGGWVWNIWGYDCVVLRLRRGTLRVGTDDPDGLLRFLESRLSEMQHPE